ncbi:MAG: MoaD/ThiS family protein [Firmicutes bacterium]|nr:MoaD/ThiS family protein [Bacillota bacterium]
MAVKVDFIGPGGLEPGTTVIQVDLTPGATIRDLLRRLVEIYGNTARKKLLQLDGVTPYVEFIVKGKIVSPDHPLEAGDEVLILPPIFGG